MRRHEDQILDELNVKTLELIARDATLVSYRIKPNLPVIGKRYGKLIPAIREYLATADGAAIAAAVARGEHADVRRRRRVARRSSRPTCSSRAPRPKASRARRRAATSSGSTRRSTTRCAREGLARELVRAVQDARKQAGLEVADRIVLLVEGDAAGRRGARASYRDYLMSETLASTWRKPGARASSLRAQEQGEAQLGHPPRARSGRARMSDAALVRLERRRVELAVARRRRDRGSISGRSALIIGVGSKSSSGSFCCRCSSSCGCTTKARRSVS